MEENGVEDMLVDEDIVFLVHYGEHTIRLELPAQETVESIRLHLVRKTGLQKEEMEFLGWDDVSDETTFSDLGISKEYHLVMRPMNGVDPEDVRLSQTYHLQVNDAENDEIYNLFFNGLQTVRDVKQHMAQLCPIPVERQQWNGWPWPCDDTQMLFDIGLKSPRHELRLSRMREPIRRSSSPREMAGYGSVDHNYEMEDDDLEEDPVDVVSRPQRGSLLPNVLLPPADAVALFEQNFEARYGVNHAEFFKGSIREAMAFAFDRPVPDRQLFVVYLHNDKSISVNIFVTQVLQSLPLMDYLRDHAVLWPWDVTNQEARNSIRQEMKEIFGEENLLLILSNRVDVFPIFLICTKTKSNLEVLKILDGTKSAQEVLDALETSQNIHRRNQEIELADQQTRERNRLVVEEQNQAYQASLSADQAKAEAKRAVEDQKRKEEELVKEALRQRQKRQEEAKSQLSPEPTEANGDGITAVRLRTPDGKSLTRRFSSSDPLKNLFRFAHANGYPEDEYNLVCSYPRKELGGLDKEKSFKDLGLTQQVAVFLEEH